MHYSLPLGQAIGQDAGLTERVAHTVFLGVRQIQI